MFPFEKKGIKVKILRGWWAAVDSNDPHPEVILFFLEGMGEGGIGTLEERVSVQVIMVVMKNALHGFVVRIA